MDPRTLLLQRTSPARLDLPVPLNLLIEALEEDNDRVIQPPEDSMARTKQDTTKKEKEVEEMSPRPKLVLKLRMLAPAKVGTESTSTATPGPLTPDAVAPTTTSSTTPAACSRSTKRKRSVKPKAGAAKPKAEAVKSKTGAAKAQHFKRARAESPVSVQSEKQNLSPCRLSSEAEEVLERCEAATILQILSIDTRGAGSIHAAGPAPDNGATRGPVEENDIKHQAPVTDCAEWTEPEPLPERRLSRDWDKYTVGASRSANTYGAVSKIPMRGLGMPSPEDVEFENMSIDDMFTKEKEGVEKEMKKIDREIKKEMRKVEREMKKAEKKMKKAEKGMKKTRKV